MHKAMLVIGALLSGIFATAAQAEMPRNVRCAITAQEAARDTGRQYQATYNRKFDLCMLAAMSRERQTTYLIERLKPYVAISPGVKPEEVAPRQEQEFTGRWVRVSPNVWVLEE